MPAVLFSGNRVKSLLKGIQLSDKATIWSDSIDPSSSGFTANQGDIFLSTLTNSIYVKTGSLDTNWTILPGGALNFTAVGNSPNSAGASVVSDTITLQPADGSNPGLVTTNTQTFAGQKTVNDSTADGLTTPAFIVVSGLPSSGNLHKNTVFTNSSGPVPDSSPTNTFASDIDINTNDSLPHWITFRNANGEAWFGFNSGGDVDFGTTQNQPVSFWTNNTQQVTINGNTGAVSCNNNISAANLSGTNTGDQTITLTSDVTGSGTGSFATTVAKIQGTTVSGTTGTGNVVFATSPTLSNPVVGTQSTSDNSTKAASTAYVTTAIANAVAGVNPAVAVQAATTSSSDTSGFTYNNGVSGVGATLTSNSNNTPLTVDGYTFTALGQRFLVKDHSTSANNGIYYVTQLQAALLPLILTRSLDFDQPSDINNTGAIPVINGTVNNTTSWVVSSTVNTIGTNAITFAKFTRNPSDYLLKSSGDINETSFSAANNQSSVANVTGLSFANSTVRSFRALVSVFVNATSSLYESFTLQGIQRGSDWQMSSTSVGDASGFVFSITSAGQIQYVNNNYSGFVSAKVSFRAETTTV